MSDDERIKKLPYEILERFVGDDMRKIATEYRKSGAELNLAAQLIDDDIKLEMCVDALMRVEALLAKEEALKLIVEKGVGENRSFVLEELKAISDETSSIAAWIRNRLHGLEQLPSE